MVSAEKLNTHQKALNINLDPTSYGSFAEIGAGQEVVRWFLVVGGASGTVAKSISAYDKEVSDDLYGVGARYVAEGLKAMLESEWTQLLKQLTKSRGTHAHSLLCVCQHHLCPELRRNQSAARLGGSPVPVTAWR